LTTNRSDDAKTMETQTVKTDKTKLGFEVTLENLGKTPHTSRALDTNQLKLDLGCGANKKRTFLGVDLVKTNATDVVADSTNLPIKDDSFDYVYSRRCIQHVKNDTQALREIYRLLKPNGKLELIVASFYGYVFYKSGLSKGSRKYDVFHLYRKHKLRKMLTEIGFANVNLNKIKSPRKIGYDFKATCQK